MVDWGIMAFFVLQLAIVFAVYYALGGVKAEKSVLLSESERLRLCSIDFKALAARVDNIEKAPADRMKKVDALADDLAEAKRETEKVRKQVESADQKIHSLNGRIAANAKAAKRAALRDDQEQDPDPQGEDEEHANAPQSPGSFPGNGQPQASAVPPSFGVLRRAGT